METGRLVEVDRPARSFEDFSVGESFVARPVAVSEEAILDFAQRYDPQIFHTDPKQARETIFGGLISSGWQVMSETFARAIVDGFLSGGANCRDVTDVRWLKPVRPGDQIHLRLTVVSVAQASANAGHGNVTFEASAINQSGDAVMTYLLHQQIARNAR